MYGKIYFKRVLSPLMFLDSTRNTWNSNLDFIEILVFRQVLRMFLSLLHPTNLAPNIFYFFLQNFTKVHGNSWIMKHKKSDPLELNVISKYRTCQ